MEAEIIELYSELSKYELIDLFYTISGNVTDNLTIVITTLFAYLALAHIAGKTLSKFQVSSITTIYSAFVLFMIGGIHRDSRSVSDIAYVLFQLDTHSDGVILAVVLIVSWLLSIVFMAQLRRADDT